MIARLIQRVTTDLTRPIHVRPWRLTEPEIDRKDARKQEADARRRAEEQAELADLKMQQKHWFERALTLTSSTDDAAGRITESGGHE